MLLAFVSAVGLALVLREHSGNVLIIAQPWRVELSLTLAVLLTLACFISLYIVLRIFAWIASGPERFRSWRGLRAENRDHQLLENGWINVLEGRYNQAEKELSKVLGRSNSGSRKVLAALALARAAHHLGEFTRRDEALDLARDNAGDDPRLKEATATVAAEMCLDQNRAQEALALLQPLQDASSRYFNATRLLLQAHRQLNNHDRVYELTRLLARRGVVEKPEALRLIETSAAARLRAGGPDRFKAIWGDLKSDERVLPEVALAAASVQESSGDFDEASKILEAAIGYRLEPRLLAAYSQCPPDQVARRLSKAEVWLKSYPDDPALLASLGNLCLTGQLWGQGERYLLRSEEIRSDVRIHALLGNLYDRLGRQADAMKHWRLASSVAGVLPALPISHELPAADMRGDPTLIDIESPPEPGFVDSDQAAPVADAADSAANAPAGQALAKAADAAQSPPRDSAPAYTSPDSRLDEYFDSAPIPGVDLSQTSDQPRDGSNRR